MKSRKTPLKKQLRGQAMVETWLLAALVVAMLFVPWDGKSGSDTVIVFMLKAIKTAYAKFIGALSLPI